MLVCSHLTDLVSSPAEFCKAAGEGGTQAGGGAALVVLERGAVSGAYVHTGLACWWWLRVPIVRLRPCVLVPGTG